MPEGVLIVECQDEEIEKSRAGIEHQQMCFMNEELAQVINVIQDMKLCGYPSEMTKEEYGLMQRIFKRCNHNDQNATTTFQGVSSSPPALLDTSPTKREETQDFICL